MVKTPGPVCRADSNSDLKHKCRSSMKRGDVCRDKVTACDGCKKNEYIEVVVRCSQGMIILKSYLNLTPDDLKIDFKIQLPSHREAA